jgi:hypothetical protein
MKIEIVRKKDMFCLETALSTICNYFDIPYQMLFARTWGYDYQGEDLCIGNNISIIDWELRDNIKQFGIIEEVITEVNADNLEYIRNAVKQGKLAIVSMDMTKFNEMNGTSYVGLYAPYLLCSYDREFVAYDLHYTHKKISMSDEVFMCACRRGLLYGAEKQKASFNFNYNIKELHRILIPSKPDFEKIEHLAKLFASGVVDLEYETKDLAEGEAPVEAPIIRKIETLSRGRNLFSLYLEYINSMITEIDIAEVCGKTSYWAGKWNLIKVILIKAYYKKDFSQDVMKKVALILYDIARGEKELYEQLLNTTVKKMEKIDCDLFGRNEKLFAKKGKMVGIDLSKFYNNAGVRLVGTEKSADMTGLGAYIEYEEKQIEKAILEHKCFYEFREIAKYPLDNMLCQGQEIDIPAGVYNRIKVLGCSDYGNFSDYLTIYYEDMEKKQIIQFSSWINKEPLFNEQVYCTGKLKETNVRLRQSEGTLFIQTIELQQRMIHSIKLPDCPTMHIFLLHLC